MHHTNAEEAQKDIRPGYSLPKRAVYYCSRMISSQLSKITKAENYDNLSKVDISAAGKRSRKFSL